MSAERKYYLRPKGGDERVELRDGFLIGRKEDCDLIIREGHPSRHHARISIDAEGLTVTDLESANGTFVNGKRIKGGERLKASDEIAFDSSTFSVLVEGGPQPADEGATVIRSVADLERTMLRPAAELEKELQKELDAAAAAKASQQAPVQPLPPKPAPEVKPPEKVLSAKPVAPPAAAVKPGSWADPDKKNNGGTQVFSREDLDKMAGNYDAGERVESGTYLQVGTGGSAGAIIKLDPQVAGSEWSIGKDSARDIVFRDEGVSGFHAKIVHQSGRWKIVDQMSANGTYINNSKVVTGFLSSGDRIRLGSVECVVVLDGQAPTPTPTPDTDQKSNRLPLLIGLGVVVLIAVIALLAY